MMHRFLQFTLMTVLSSCANPDAVLFVTDTKIAIDADTRPPNLTIGYGRDEVFIGPNFDSGTGGIPPVVGRLESNLSILSPQIDQVYATGRAATLVTSDDQDLSEPRQLAEDEEKKVAWFSTGSKLGLNVAFNESGFESVSFGYKRKELSFIPLVRLKDADEEGKTVDTYGSVVAAIGVNTKVNSLPDTSVGLSQFFATGLAAEHIARDNPDVRRHFQLIADQATRPVSDRYVESQSGDRLQAWSEDQTNFDKLESWWKERNPDVDVSILILGESYEEDRRAAIDHFSVPEL